MLVDTMVWMAIWKVILCGSNDEATTQKFVLEKFIGNCTVWYISELSETIFHCINNPFG